MKFVVCLNLLIIAITIVSIHGGEDMMRKSIVFNKARPDIFFCPIKKPKGFDQLYVYARPITKLCEFDGKPPPKDYKSDCYNDVDETEYACKEKQRIMKKLPQEVLDQIVEVKDQTPTKWKQKFF